jgi:hypothetical protein
VYLETDAGAGSAEGILVSNVVAEGATLVGFEAAQTTLDASFVNCSSKNSQTGAILGGGFAKFLGGTLENSLGDGLVVGEYGDNAKVSNTHFRVSGGVGIRVNPGASNVTILNNLIAGASVLAGGPIDDLGTGTMIRPMAE